MAVLGLRSRSWWCWVTGAPSLSFCLLRPLPSCGLVPSVTCLPTFELMPLGLEDVWDYRWTRVGGKNHTRGDWRSVDLVGVVCLVLCPSVFLRCFLFTGDSQELLSCDVRPATLNKGNIPVSGGGVFWMITCPLIHISFDLVWSASLSPCF